MKHSVIFEYLSKKFELTVHNPKKVCNDIQYVLKYKGWCQVGLCFESASEFILIIGYCACFIDNLFGVIRIITSLGDPIDDNTIWSWIVGAIQKPTKYEA
jgi:hypothetical protein